MAEELMTFDEALELVEEARRAGAQVDTLHMRWPEEVARGDESETWYLELRVPGESGTWTIHNREEYERYMSITSVCHHPTIEIGQEEGGASGAQPTARCVLCGLVLKADIRSHGWIANQLATTLLQVRGELRKQEFEGGSR